VVQPTNIGFELHIPAAASRAQRYQPLRAALIFLAARIKEKEKSAADEDTDINHNFENLENRRIDMEGDLLGFDGPSPPADSATTSAAVEKNGNGEPAAPSFDLLSGSPVKQALSSEEPDTATATSIPSTSDNDSALDFAKPPPPSEENTLDAMDATVSMNGGLTYNDNTMQHQQSVNLMDFGGSSNGGVGDTEAPALDLVTPSSETFPPEQQEAQQLDLFDGAPLSTATESNLLDHRDSFAPVVSDNGGDGGLVDLFVQSASVAPSADATMTDNTGTAEGAIDDPFSAFSSAAPAATSTVDPFTTNMVPTSELSGDNTAQPEEDNATNAGQEQTIDPTDAIEKAPDNANSARMDEPQKSKDVEKSDLINVDTSTQHLNGGDEPKSSPTEERTLNVAPSLTVNDSLPLTAPPSAGIPKVVESIQEAETNLPLEPVTTTSADEEDKKEEDQDTNDLPPSNSTPAAARTTPVKYSKDAVGDPPSQAKSPIRPIPPSPSPDTSDETTLKQHIMLLEKELHAAHSLIMELQHHDNDEEQRPGDAVMVELQANLQKEMTRRAEAEDKMRLAQTECQKLGEEYKTFKVESKASLDQLSKELETVTMEKNELLTEVEQIREERDEQARKEMALTTRLNAAKKKEAVKANAAEHYEDQVEHLQQQAEKYKQELESMTAERDQLNQELIEWKTYAEKRTKQLETALNDEKKLNDERKRKMKGFVEAKTEEVRAAKADYVSLQTELDQTSHSLKELNQRYKQLHAQWVQSQTRNRELQRDMTKMKKDSEKMLKAGGTLEARLSRSAQESEDHKNKRIQAKNELMSVLSQLEAERAVNARLQESLRMTFTPKALSQQQTIQEAIDEFEGALQRLSIRLGRPLPPPMNPNDALMANPMGDQASEDGSVLETDFDSLEDDDARAGVSSSNNLSEINSNKVLQKLEVETQRVSRKIVSFSSSVERMHALLEGAGPRNCVDVFSNMFLSGQAAQNEETRAITGERRPTARNYRDGTGTLT
jgi:hypothetical protein